MRDASLKEPWSLCYSAPVTSPCVCKLQPGLIESLLLSIHHRPWLMGVYVFVVGLPVILFISFMWPDKV